MSRHFYATAGLFALLCDRHLRAIAQTDFDADRLDMASDDIDNFHVRPGRSRAGGKSVSPRSLSFVRQVEIAVRKAGGDPSRIGRGPASAGGRKGEGGGRFNARGRGAKVVASFPRGAGGWQRDSAGLFRVRRVVVKARVVKLNPRRGSRGPKMRGAMSKAVDAHLRYLERDGVTRDGEKGHAYSAIENEADGRAFVERGRDDRHQFRFIVAPEDASDMADLRGFTRDLMRQVEKDLDTGLEWIAVDHHNTGHPHTHIIVRGVLDDGRILNIAGDYIAHGVRHRASELVTLELGHQSEIELQTKLANEVAAERLTRLDKILLAEQREQGVIDLRLGEGASYLVRENRALLLGRARRLERYGLTTELETGRWAISDRAEAMLKELGVIIADLLDGLGLSYGYEQPFTAPDGSARYPDFTIDDGETGRRLLIEHLGILDRPDYFRRWKAKEKWYRGAGVLPIGEGEAPVGLLTTSEVGGFDAARVKAQIAAALGL